MNGSPRPDEVLLLAARAGDGEAFGEFYRRRRALLLGYLRPRVPDTETAADLMAESFAGALLAIRDARRPIPDEPVAWLLTIARNKLIDSVRRGRVEQAARDRLALDPLEIDDEDIARIENLAENIDMAANLEPPPDGAQNGGVPGWTSTAPEGQPARVQHDAAPTRPGERVGPGRRGRLSGAGG